MLKRKRKDKRWGWFAWCLRLFSMTICLSMILIATFSPVLPLRPSLTLENVPSPIVLPSLYFPMFFSDPIWYWFFPHKLFLTMISVHVACVIFAFTLNAIYSGGSFFFVLFFRITFWSIRINNFLFQSFI